MTTKTELLRTISSCATCIQRMLKATAQNVAVEVNMKRSYAHVKNVICMLLEPAKTPLQLSVF